MRKILLVLAGLSLSAPAQAQHTLSGPDKQLAADIDAFVQSIMALSASTALAVAVVKGDDPILVKGYGYADVERKRSATANTGFYIASTTKAFTALAIAMMAERGSVNLDAPISKYLPDLELAPPLSPDSITLRMLLSHTHGISSDGPVVWRTAFNGTPPNPELIKLMQLHKANPKGHAYAYTNVGYNLAGLVVDRVAHGSWKNIIQAEVLDPLKMTRTSAFLSKYDSTDLAMPYSAESEGYSRLHYAKDDASMQAAGGLVSTATDLARWLQVQINGGKLNGKQVIPARVIAETHRKQTDVNEAGAIKRTGYGLGWTIGSYGAQDVIFHTGGFSAFSAIILFDPEQKIGVAVMSNESKIGSGAGLFITEYVLDRASETLGYQKKYDDLLARLPGMIAQRRNGIAQDRARRAARPQNLPYALSTLAGTFTSDVGGTMTWKVSGDRLWVQTGNLKSVAEVYDVATNRIRVELEPGVGEVVAFDVAEGKAKALEFRGMKFSRTD